MPLICALLGLRPLHWPFVRLVFCRLLSIDCSLRFQHSCRVCVCCVTSGAEMSPILLAGQKCLACRTCGAEMSRMLQLRGRNVLHFFTSQYRRHVLLAALSGPIFLASAVLRTSASIILLWHGRGTQTQRPISLSRSHWGRDVSHMSHLRGRDVSHVAIIAGQKCFAFLDPTVPTKMSWSKVLRTAEVYCYGMVREPRDPMVSQSITFDDLHPHYVHALNIHRFATW